MFQLINKEIEVMNKDHSKIKTTLSDQVYDLRQKIKEQRLELGRFEKLKMKDKEMVEKGIQLQLEDLNEFDVLDEINDYKNKINTFIVEGKSQPEEWVNVIITDICGSKIMDDYFNYTRG